MVKITTDSTADLNELFQERGVGVLPLIVTLGDNSFLDGETIKPQDIFDFYTKNKKLPKTAARSPEDFEEFFKTFTDKGDEVVHINLSSKISMTHDNAVAAANRLRGVHVIDSLSLSTGTGLLVLYAKDLADQGKSAREISELVAKRVPYVQASFVVDTMEYLYKGGRCNALTRIAATVLRIKPTILVKSGAMDVGKKYMGSVDKIITKYVEATLQEFDHPDETRVFITHSCAKDEVVAAVKKKLKEIAHFKEIIVTVAGSTITSHCGKGTLGILYINDAGVNEI